MTQFKQAGILVIGILLGLGLVSCQERVETTTEGEKAKVVSTSTIIADLTAEIGGDEIDHVSLLSPGDDPHIYEPKPQDTVALENADLILYNGYNLEPNVIKLIEASGKNAKKFAVGETIKPLDFNYQGKIEPDPHVWGSAENAIIMVNAIRDRLIELSPEDETEFRENAALLTEELTKLDNWITEQIQTIPENQRKLVTSHDAFQYYANAYGLEVIGTLIGISTEEQPSAQTVKNLTEEIKKTGVKAIFAETTINPTLIKTVAEEASVSLASTKLYSDSLGERGSDADSYVKMLVRNTQTIVEALGGNYREFVGN
jgi:manganese/iron transport system substrate-binding protein